MRCNHRTETRNAPQKLNLRKHCRASVGRLPRRGNRRLRSRPTLQVHLVCKFVLVRSTLEVDRGQRVSTRVAYLSPRNLSLAVPSPDEFETTHPRPDLADLALRTPVVSLILSFPGAPEMNP